MHWLKPELVAEIEFAGWTGGGNIRQAAFKGLREDKPAREVVAEIPADDRLAKRRGPRRHPRSRSTANAVGQVMGVVDLQARQGLVAGRRRWRPSPSSNWRTISKRWATG